PAIEAMRTQAQCPDRQHNDHGHYRHDDGSDNTGRHPKIRNEDDVQRKVPNAEHIECCERLSNAKQPSRQRIIRFLTGWKQRIAETLRIGPALVRLPLEAAVNGECEIRWKIRHGRSQWLRVLGQTLCERLHWTLGIEWTTTGNHFVGDNAKRVQV